MSFDGGTQQAVFQVLIHRLAFGKFDDGFRCRLHVAKADTAEATIISQGGVISVQVLNEFASVASRKLRMTYPEIREVLETVRAVCKVQPLTVDIHEHGLQLAERYGFSVYDALILATALKVGCGILYSEDMQNGHAIDDHLVITNPFVT